MPESLSFALDRVSGSLFDNQSAFPVRNDPANRRVLDTSSSAGQLPAMFLAA
jgi:hypothetical protein